MESGQTHREMDANVDPQTGHSANAQEHKQKIMQNLDRTRQVGKGATQGGNPGPFTLHT